MKLHKFQKHGRLYYHSIDSEYFSTGYRECRYENETMDYVDEWVDEIKVNLEEDYQYKNNIVESLKYHFQ